MYNCDICSQGFSTKQRLLYHVQHSVCIKDNHICPHCNKNFITSTRLKRHNNNAKKCKQTEFICEYCGKSFSRNSSLVRHVKKYCKRYEDDKKIVIINKYIIGNNNVMNNNNSININVSADTLISKNINEIGNDFGNSIKNNPINKKDLLKKLNDFCRDDLSYMADIDELRNNMSCSYDIEDFISDLFIRANCDRKHPENHNIEISNLRENRITVYIEGLPITANREKVYFKKIYHLNRFILDTFGEKIDETNYKSRFRGLTHYLNKVEFNWDENKIFGKKENNYFINICKMFDNALLTMKRNGHVPFNKNKLRVNHWKNKNHDVDELDIKSNINIF